MHILRRLMIRASIGLVFLVGYLGWRTYSQWQSEQTFAKVQDTLAADSGPSADGDQSQDNQGQADPRAEAVRRQIIDEGDGLVDQCLQRPEGVESLHKGKVIVWNGLSWLAVSMSKEDPQRELHLGLPKELQGGFSDPEFTVVWIARQEDVKVKSYNPEIPGATISDIPGCRKDWTVCVFQWPSKRLIGWDVVKGNEPDDSVGITPNQSVVYGDAAGPLSGWITEHLLSADHVKQ